mgnify:CR=1 FL=1
MLATPGNKGYIVHWYTIMGRLFKYLFGLRAPKEVAPEPVLPDFREPLIPDMGNERVSEPEKTATQPESGQEKQPDQGTEASKAPRMMDWKEVPSNNG